MDITAIVKKLVGPIDPVGETREDERRYENIQVMTKTIDELLTELKWIGKLNKDRQEFSMKRAGNHAQDFLNAIEPD